jgi:hypothetical protein
MIVGTCQSNFNQRQQVMLLKTKTHAGKVSKGPELLATKFATMDAIMATSSLMPNIVLNTCASQEKICLKMMSTSRHWSLHTALTPDLMIAIHTTALRQCHHYSCICNCSCLCLELSLSSEDQVAKMRDIMISLRS